MDLKKIYLAYKSAETNKVHEELLKQGKWPYSPPIGYMFERIGSRRKGYSNLIVDPIKSQWVKRIFELYAANAYSLVQIKVKIEEEFNIKMTRSHVYEIVKNPFYGGKMLKKGILYPHTYPLIVDAFIYERAMEILNSEKLVTKRRNTQPYAFRALMRCFDCGLAITPEKHKGIVYYHCTQSNGKHNAVWVNEKDMAWILKDHILQVLKELPQYKEALKIEEWNVFHDEIGIERIRIICGKLFKKLFLHKNKALSHELYNIDEVKKLQQVKVAPIITSEGTLEDTIRILCNMPHSIEELMAITKKDMSDIQNILIDMQINGLIDQDELGNWKIT